MIYFISDTHFNHTNIIEYCNRPFNSTEQMNETILNNWNNIINNDDMVYHLGDLALSRQELIIDIVSKLKGKKYLIRGNHDKWSIATYEEFRFTVLRNPPIKLEKYKLLLSHYPIEDTRIPKGYINVHGHIHNHDLYNDFDSFSPEKYSREKHINISCEVTDFKPISIDELERRIRWSK